MKKVLNVILGICFSQLMFAQSAVGTYSFINYDENRLIFDCDSSTFMNLFKKLNDVNGGDIKKLTIAHIGGSHVQGGVWSNTFLEGFQSSFNVQGGGYFVFPYKIGKTNSQPYAKSFSTGHWKLCRSIRKDFCLPLGMNGLSVSTDDSASVFGVSLTNKAVCRKFNSVRVYHNFNCSFELNCNLHVNKEDCKDEGYTVFEFDELLDSVSFYVNKVDTMIKNFTLFGFSLEDKTSSGFYLAGLGANGASTSSFLRCNLFESQFKTIAPDIVVLSLGVNDVQGKGFTIEDFVAHYDSLINIIKKASPDCAIILTTATDNYIKRKTPNKRTDIAREGFLELMRHHQCAVWDMYGIMGGYKSIYKWYRSGLAARDRVHFNSKGYRICGNLMFEAVYKSYLSNQKLVNK